MLTACDLRKGVRIIIDGEPYEVLDSNPMKKAQRRVVIQTKLKNLLTGNALERNFHQGEAFEEAELTKLSSKFLYNHRGTYFFCEEENPSKRFELSEELLGTRANFLKPNGLVEANIFNEKIVSVSLPIKTSLRVSIFDGMLEGKLNQKEKNQRAKQVPDGGGGGLSPAP